MLKYISLTVINEGVYRNGEETFSSQLCFRAVFFPVLKNNGAPPDGKRN